MIDLDVLNRHVTANGLWHATTTARSASIDPGGVVPGSECGHNPCKPGHIPRVGLIYLASTVVYLLDRVRSDPETVFDVVYEIDVRQLSAEQFVPDEDRVAEAFQGMFDFAPTPQHWVSRDIHSASFATRAEWAAAIPEFDGADVTANSLASGAVGYRGRIAPTAIRRCEWPMR